MKKLYIGWPAREQLKAAAVDSYPNECSGWLIGSGPCNSSSTCVSVFPFQQADMRTGEGINTETSEGLCNEFLGDWVIGGFHSHLESTTRGMSDDDKISCHEIEIVVSLRRGKRKKWLWHFQAYHEHFPTQWRKMEVIFL